MELVQLVLVNNSKHPGNMIIFQRYNDRHTLLAWFSKYLYPHGRVAFSWDPGDICFAWSAKADVGPGTKFEMAQTAVADMNANRAVVLSYDADHRTYFFKDERPGSDYPYPAFMIVQDATIPPNGAIVGVGVAGRATYAVPAMPNMHVAIDPRCTTWVTLGKAGDGEFFDIADALEPVQIEFPTNVRSLTVTLNEDNSWTVTNNIMMAVEE